MNDGDWICSDPNCANINFARRIYCYRCNKDSGKAFKKKLGTEIGKSAADKSRGLFNADDWHCSKCGNVNWARRQTCNVCSAPKFGEPEARTGYGGGYDERGNVEYRPREPSSDDEYDEFGRRKRKRKDQQENNQGGTSQDAGDAGEQDDDDDEEEEEEKEVEEEEESGDEADLAKYDLCGSDEEHANSSKDDAGDKSKDQHASKETGSESGDKNGEITSADPESSNRRSRSSSSSKSDHRSANLPKNKLDELDLNSERESVLSSPKGRKSRSRSPHPRSTSPSVPGKSRDSRSTGESRSDYDRCNRSRGACVDRKQRRNSRNRKAYGGRKHRLLMG